MKTLPKFNPPASLYYIAGRRSRHNYYYTMALGWTRTGSCNRISLTETKVKDLIPILEFDSASVHSNALSALNHYVLNSGQDEVVLLSSPCINFSTDVKIVIQDKGRHMISECERLGIA